LCSALECHLELHASFQKRSIRNRTEILGPNGKQLLIVPLKKGKNGLPISQVQIAYDEDWPSEHIKSLKTAYNTSPYFEYYAEDIQRIIKTEYKYLIELNDACAQYFYEKFNIEAPKPTSQFLFPRDFEGIDYRLKNTALQPDTAHYTQVFEHKFGFVSNLSILDLLMNTGPEITSILKQTAALLFTNKQSK